MDISRLVSGNRVTLTIQTGKQQCEHACVLNGTLNCRSRYKSPIRGLKICSLSLPLAHNYCELNFISRCYVKSACVRHNLFNLERSCKTDHKINIGLGSKSSMFLVISTYLSPSP